MKCLMILALVLFTYCYSFSQFDKLTKFEKLKTNSVKVGATVAEVRSIFGNPKAIEIGFPDSHEFILSVLPEQRGQLNYTTWMYFYPDILISWEDTTTADYLINGFSTTEEIYNLYKTIDRVYFLGDYILNPYDGRSAATLNNSNVRIEKIISTKVLPTKKEAYYFTPVLCIIFEKGTQSVAEKRMYFIKKKQTLKH